MLKKKTWILLSALTLVSLLLAPAPSQAALAGSSSFFAAVPMSPLAKLAQWLDFLVDGAKATKPQPHRAPARRAVSLPEKHGCGIDPQGQPYCIP